MATKGGAVRLLSTDAGSVQEKSRDKGVQNCQQCAVFKMCIILKLFTCCHTLCFLLPCSLKKSFFVPNIVLQERTL